MVISSMDKYDLKEIITKVQKENEIFKEKSKLASLSNEIPEKLVGRNKETTQLVRYLISFENDMIVPLISVFGRSGSGKSSLVKFVCKNIPDIEFSCVNFRKARTLFGCANLILGEMGHEGIKNASGMNKAIDNIKGSITEKFLMSGKKLFVLVLDEFDVIFFDRRGNPSDFVYRLIEMQSDLAQEMIPMTIITISNNVIGDYEFDDRVRSRIGSSEIFFRPFSKDEILGILKGRALKAFGREINGGILDHIAAKCSDEHGDIRRAIELLRVTAEIAVEKKKPMSIEIVDKASARIQSDRLEITLKGLSHQSKMVCLTIAALTKLTGKDWHATSNIFEQYRKFLPPGSTLISYRQVHNLLVDLQNTGMLSSSTTSMGRNGYTSKYKINVDPELVGKQIDEEKWKKIDFEKSANELATLLNNGTIKRAF